MILSRNSTSPKVDGHGKPPFTGPPQLFPLANHNACFLSFWTNETLTGPRWHTIPSYPFTRIPCYVRENTVLLLGPEDVTVPDYEYAEVGLEVRKYEIEVGEGEVVVDVPSGRGAEWAGRVVVRGGEVRGEGVKLL